MPFGSQQPDRAAPAASAPGSPPRPSVSVLMAVYGGDRAPWFAEALESVAAQTVAPDQLVLVVDGPVGPEHEEAIARYRSDPRVGSVEIVRLRANQGLARALNAGLERCGGEWTMRMDSDDLCHPDRLRHQIAHIQEHPDIGIVSSWCEEFFDGEAATRVKSSPIQHDAVVQALRWRNVLVHPTVLIRTETLSRVGGYRTEFGRLEDYDLFVRLALEGARFHVLPAALVRVRASLAQSARRGGWRYSLNEIRFRTFCLRAGFLNPAQYVAITSAYMAFRLAGPALRGRLYGLARV